MMDVLIPFVLLLGGVIFFHELGHFLVAKLFGVKVEKFSIGFGPAIVKRTVGETEYLIAWFPLGGYVKMLGELPGEELAPEERERSFNQQAVWKRVSIAAAGPAMNLVLPVVVLAGVYVVGVPTPTTLIGGVVPDSPAAAVGIRPGDRIVAVDGREVWRWRDLTVAIQAGGAAGDALELEVERGAQRLRLQVEPHAEGGRQLIGIDHSPPAPRLGFVPRDSPAGRAGLRFGDTVARVDGTPVADWYELQHALPPDGRPLELEVRRPSEGALERLVVTVPARDGPWSVKALGVRYADSEVKLVESGSPADNAGLQPGDLIVGVEGEPLESFQQLAEIVRGGEGAPLRLALRRGGRRLHVELEPERRPIELEGEIREAWAIGVHGGPARVAGELRDDVVRNPLAALWVGARRTVDIFGTTVTGIRKLLTREVGFENVAGPIGIGKIAADSYEEGWFQFFWVMAVISVNLAILNLLPIPILDGGQICFAVAEGIKGAPLSLRVREIAVQVGLSLLVLLMGFAFWNDLSRYWQQILGYFQDLV